MSKTAISFLVVFLAVAASSASAHDGKSHVELPKLPPVATKTTMPEGAEKKARQYFTDLPVVTQDGNELRFFTDVLKDRIVLLSLFYTNCTGMCPLNNAKLAEVQDLLGSDSGRSIFLVSLSVDPENDTPEVLKDYAAKFNAKEGWLFLTGDKDNIKDITYRLGQTSPQIETHNPLFMIGNVPIERWSKVLPNVPAELIVARLRLMAELDAAN
jgi:cytochrome oxidase Cu insertion factor (SCO1/SenC/PrrC family)